MNIQNVKFLKSIVELNQRPVPLKPEIAVVGRSNVGKSSLINTLFNRKNLAKISSTPGKTRLINYFLVDDQLYFVDLPGYGYARTSRKEQNRWKQNIETYLKNNQSLKLVFLLLDVRHSLLSNDRLMVEWLHFYKIPFHLILTKSDKVSNNQFQKIRTNLSREFRDQGVVRFSARNRAGREDIIKILEGVIESIDTK